jgi:hypothetical protein
VSICVEIDDGPCVFHVGHLPTPSDVFPKAWEGLKINVKGQDSEEDDQVAVDGGMLGRIPPLLIFFESQHPVTDVRIIMNRVALWVLAKAEPREKWESDPYGRQEHLETASEPNTVRD